MGSREFVEIRLTDAYSNRQGIYQHGINGIVADKNTYRHLIDRQIPPTLRRNALFNLTKINFKVLIYFSYL
jgi:hypothetical protein